MSLDPQSPPLGLPDPAEVRVWLAWVPLVADGPRRLAELLSAEERAAAERFLRAEDRTRYVVAHGVLREILGHCLGLPPAAVALGRGPWGKPELTGDAARTGLAFNLSHSGDLVAVAVAAGRAVGVDVEAGRTTMDVMDLAAGHFAPAEIAALASVDPADRRAAFIRCWTRKEAYVKARGEGLGFPLPRFAVAFGADQAPGLLWVADEPDAPRQWAVFDLAPGAGYAGAVVVAGPPVSLVVRRWPTATIPDEKGQLNRE